MPERRDPWSILGVPRTATVEEIKAQYKKLALSLHPDKQGSHLTPEQARENEERFKEVSVAYRVATDMASNHTTMDDFERWRTMWERVEGMIRSQNFVSALKDALRGTLHDMAKVAVRNMSQQEEVSSDVETESSTGSSPTDECISKAETRTFKMMVGLEEVHTRASRRVRLFLHDHPEEPIFVNVDFDSFPEMVYYHRAHGNTYKMVLEMAVRSHPVYYWDPSLGGWDIYTTVPINLHDYLVGTTKNIPCLGKPEGVIPLTVPPFANLKRPIVYEGIGLRNRGNMYVMLDLVMPSRSSWDAVLEKDPEGIQEFLCVCKSLNAPHDVPS